MGDAPIVERYTMRVFRDEAEFDVGYSEITVYEPRTLPVDRVLAPFVRAAASDARARNSVTVCSGSRWRSPERGRSRSPRGRTGLPSSVTSCFAIYERVPADWPDP